MQVMEMRKVGKQGPLYPNGWPRTVHAALYHIRRKRFESTVEPFVIQQLFPSTQLNPTSEMSDYG